MNAHFEWIDEKPTNGAGSLAEDPGALGLMKRDVIPKDVRQGGGGGPSQSGGDYEISVTFPDGGMIDDKTMQKGASLIVAKGSGGAFSVYRSVQEGLLGVSFSWQGHRILLPSGRCAIVRMHLSYGGFGNDHDYQDTVCKPASKAPLAPPDAGIRAGWAKMPVYQYDYRGRSTSASSARSGSSMSVLHGAPDEKLTNGAGSLAGFEWLGSPGDGTLGVLPGYPQSCYEMEAQCGSSSNQVQSLKGEYASIKSQYPQGTPQQQFDMEQRVRQYIQPKCSQLARDCRSENERKKLAAWCSDSSAMHTWMKQVLVDDGGKNISTGSTFTKADCLEWKRVYGEYPTQAKVLDLADIDAIPGCSLEVPDCEKIVGGQPPVVTQCPAGYSGTPPNCVKDAPPMTGTMKSGMSAGGIFLLASMALGGMYAAWKYGGTSQSRAA